MFLARNQLHPYQEKAKDFIKQRKSCQLWLDMGLGKTVTTLTAIQELIDFDFVVTKVLVIAPLQVANSVWAEEANNWEHLKHLNCVKCTGSLKERKDALNSDADVYIINRENVQWLVLGYAKKWKWTMLVIDEASSFKSHKSGRFKWLKKVIDKFTYRVLLTGTPVPNGYIDLFSQVFLIDQGERLGRTYTAFVSRYFDKSGYMGYDLTLKSGAANNIQNKIRDLTLVMEAKDYLEIPDKINVTKKIDLPDEIQAQYKALKKEFVLAVDKDTIIDVDHAAIVGNKLLQICNGAIYDNDRNAIDLHDEKIKALKQIVEDNPWQNILVAYNYKTDAVKIRKAIGAIDIKDGPNIQGQWNKGDIKVMMAHPASAGHGLNLQAGGSIIVWFGLNWSLELYQQFNARLHRQGQQHPVTIVHLVTAGCIDESIMSALLNKNITQSNLINTIKSDFL